MATFTADEDALETLYDDVGGLWCRPVAVLDAPPDPLTFLRDFVHPSAPCIINSAITCRDADGGEVPLTLTLDDIIDRVGEDAELTVDVTPDGHGDCVRTVQAEDDGSDLRSSTRRMFVKPHEETMGIGKFRDLLRRSNGNDGLSVCNSAQVDLDGLEQYPLHSPAAGPPNEESCCLDEMDRPPPIVYYSQQNDCMRTEASKLFATKIFPETFSFAEEAFGTGPPDAVNLWIGNERSVSSMHKDHYENLFYVCSGQKEFILCPPADVIFLHEGEFSSCTFRPVRDSAASSFSWGVVSDGAEERTKWIEPDIAKHMKDAGYRSEFPLLPKAHPTKVLVSAGSILYIPALWYHRVTQTCETVGVNYWYDMKFDSPQWCYFNFLQSLKAKRKESADDEQAA
ncbi:hypothetical protein ACHAXT_005532 [Thalassiosira profunda]